MTPRADSQVDIPPFPSSKDPDERRFRDQVRAALDRVANGGDKLLNLAPEVNIVKEQFDNAGTPTGRVTVQVRDVGNNFGGFVRLAFRNDGGAFDFSDPTDTVVYTESDSSSPYQFDIELHPKYGAVFGVAVPWFPPDAVDAEWVLEDGGFDYDRRPRTTFGVYLSGGDVFLVWQGDEDTQSVRYATSVAPAAKPTASAVQSGSLVASQSSDGELIYSGLAEGETLHVRARGYGTSAGSADDIQSFTDYEESIERPIGERIPRGFITTSASGSEGVGTLTLIDPAGVVNAVYRKDVDKVDGEDFDDVTDGSGWVSDTSPPSFDNLTGTVALQPKHNAGIGFAARYDLGEGAGNEFVYFGPAFFDRDTIAEITSLTLSFDTDGSVLFDYKGDDDVSYVKWGASSSGFPGDTAVQNQSLVSPDTQGQVNEQSSAAFGDSIDTNIVLSARETCYVKVVPYNVNDEAGPAIQGRTNFFDNPDYTLTAEAVWVRDVGVPSFDPSGEFYKIIWRFEAGPGIEEVEISWPSFTGTVDRDANGDGGLVWGNTGNLAISGDYNTSYTQERFTIDASGFDITFTGRYGSPLTDGPVITVEMQDIDMVYIRASNTFAFDGSDLQLPTPADSGGAPDMADGPTQYWTLTADATLGLPTNMEEGESMTVVVNHNGYQLTLNGTYVGPASTFDPDPGGSGGVTAVSIWRTNSAYYAVGTTWA